MVSSKRILICANPDLNFIDGSSIWLQTIALALAKCKKTQIDLICRSTPDRPELFEPLRSCQNIRLIDGTHPAFWQGRNTNRVNLSRMADLANFLSTKQHYDIVVVRGLDIALSLEQYPELLAKSWLYLTDIPQSLGLYNAKLRMQLTSLGHSAQRILCQTPSFKTLWQALVPGIDSTKLVIYSPVIPDFSTELPSLANRQPIAVYAGKYKADWKTLDMVQAWPAVHAAIPQSSLVMIGDKIHEEKTPENYASLMLELLNSTNGLTWLGALSREQVQQHLREARVGLSWRDESLNDSIEYSTKILEYGGAGCAAILNRNTLHEELLGTDYPLFANSREEFSEKLTLALNDLAVCEFAAKRLRELAKSHTFSKRVELLQQWLAETPLTIPKPRKQTVLVAGHDLKFFGLLQAKLAATGKYEFIIDQWQGHNKHDAERSTALLAQADIIFCEWCLGNLVWYSHNKLPYQKLVARFHLQEKDLPYVADAKWDAIDHISYVSEFIRREGQKAFNFPFEKTSVIANLLDENKFTPKKKMGDANYTLGIIGVTPARKRLDRALDVLEMLLEHDSRYCLRVKGKHPLDYSWLVNREHEVAYYRQIFERINSSAKLRHKVIFDPQGDDINEWFSLVGFILSPSDFESFHMAVGEGMLTGAVPVIWPWDGATEIWPEEFVIADSKAAAEFILSCKDNLPLVRGVVSSVYDTNFITKLWSLQL